MNKKVDNIIKNYLSNNDRFRDIINYYVFNGKDVVKESNLKEVYTKLVDIDGDKFVDFRDSYKEVNIKEDDKCIYVLIGIENQTEKEYELLLRVALYESFLLEEELNNNDRIKPILTIVINFGEKKWECPKCLYDYFDNVDEEISEFVSNYFINVFEPYQMTDDDINKLKSDFKVVCDYLRNSNSVTGIDLVRKKNYKLEDETIKVINYLTDSKLELDEERDEINMCKGLDEFAAKAKSEGKAEGRAEGETNNLNKNIKTMHSNGASEEMIAKLLSLDINYVKEVLSK